MSDARQSWPPQESGPFEGEAVGWAREAMTSRAWPDPGYGRGDDGTPLTFEESAALRLMRQLADRWPATLALAEADGTVRVVRAGDTRYSPLATVEGIVTQGWHLTSRQLAIKPVSLAGVDYTKYCWGDDLSVLPRTCLIGMPKVPEPAWGMRPGTAYEALTVMQLGRGYRVPWHPSACQSIVGGGQECGHAQVWHRHRTRTRPCLAPGCTCLDFVRMWPAPEADPRGGQAGKEG